MTSRILRPLLIALAIVATACGGSATTATEAPAEEVVDVTEAPDTTSAPETTAAAETTAAPDTTVAPEETAAPEAPAGDADGMAIFEANCARCHGADGSGGRGPSLQGIADKAPDKTRALGLVTNGGSNMPSFGDKLAEAEVIAVVDYVYEAFPASS